MSLSQLACLPGIFHKYITIVRDQNNYLETSKAPNSAYYILFYNFCHLLLYFYLLNYLLKIIIISRRCAINLQRTYTCLPAFAVWGLKEFGSQKADFAKNWGLDWRIGLWNCTLVVNWMKTGFVVLCRPMDHSNSCKEHPEKEGC